MVRDTSMAHCASACIHVHSEYGAAAPNACMSICHVNACTQQSRGPSEVPRVRKAERSLLRELPQCIIMYFVANCDMCEFAEVLLSDRRRQHSPLIVRLARSGAHFAKTTLSENLAKLIKVCDLNIFMIRGAA